jgi:TolA-binding protein
MTNPQQLEMRRRELNEALYRREAFRACEERLRTVQEYQETYSSMLESFRQDENTIETLSLRVRVLEMEHRMDQLQDDLDEATQREERLQEENQEISEQLEELRTERDQLEEQHAAGIARIQAGHRHAPYQGVRGTLGGEIRYGLTTLSPQESAPFIRGFISRTYNLSGGTTRDTYTAPSGLILAFKIAKVTDGKFGFLQLRPFNRIDYYILAAYSRGDDRLYVFICPSRELYELFPGYASYSHGTEEANGSITRSNIGLDSPPSSRARYEYSLKFDIKRGDSKASRLFRVFMRDFNTSEEGLHNFLSGDTE